LGILTTIYNSLTWLLDNQERMAGFFNDLLAIIPELTAYHVQPFRDGLVRAFEGIVGLVLDFAASQLGLGSLKQDVRTVLSYVPAQVDKALVTVVGAIARGLFGGTQSGRSPARWYWA
jgi:hypothetical protein